MEQEQISLFEETNAPKVLVFEGNREQGLKRLEAFAPYTARAYASTRNFDLGISNRSNISTLSPWIKHRLISEEEVLRETLKQHSFKASEKFIQEAFWRSYFKGWLEQRPDVWNWYREDLLHAIEVLEKDKRLRSQYDEAIQGQTGIIAFDHWANELVETGYLHNHARMWFASIWIFTLRLPWELGADFFYRHLLDGDAASNTCSWRWVAGLHTKGKNYTASASNIERFTKGHFSGDMGLAKDPLPLFEDREALQTPMPLQITEDAISAQFIVLATEEDCLLETLLTQKKPTAICGMLATNERSPLAVGESVKTFSRRAVEDCLSRGASHFGCQASMLDNHDWAKTLLEFAQKHDTSTIVTAHVPVGPVREKLSEVERFFNQHNIKLIQIMRNYDAMTWPHATRGFFKLKKQIPKLINELRLS